MEREVTTNLDCLFTIRNYLAHLIVIRLLNQFIVQSIVGICFVLYFRVSESISNGKALRNDEETQNIRRKTRISNRFRRLCYISNNS